jgi:hypothetical protein
MTAWFIHASDRFLSKLLDPFPSFNVLLLPDLVRQLSQASSESDIPSRHPVLVGRVVKLLQNRVRNPMGLW